MEENCGLAIDDSLQNHYFLVSRVSPNLFLRKNWSGQGHKVLLIIRKSISSWMDLLQQVCQDWKVNNSLYKSRLEVFCKHKKNLVYNTISIQYTCNLCMQPNYIYIQGPINTRKIFSESGAKIILGAEIIHRMLTNTRENENQ